MLGHSIPVGGLDDDRDVQSRVPTTVPFENIEAAGDEPFERLTDLSRRTLALSDADRLLGRPSLDRPGARDDAGEAAVRNRLFAMSPRTPLIANPVRPLVVTFPSIANRTDGPPLLTVMGRGIGRSRGRNT